MTSALVSWVGLTDLDAAEGKLDKGLIGPIASALSDRQFDQVYFLYDQPQKKRVKAFLAWVASYTASLITPKEVFLSSPVDYPDIHDAFDGFLTDLLGQQPELDITIHLSPGTPAMASISVLLGKTKCQARFIQSSPQNGVLDVNIPFDITAEFLPSLLAGEDKKLKTLSAAGVLINVAFADIITQNPDMKRLIEKAQRIATRDVPVLIMGESGTGKELFAKAIHNSSLRKDKVMVVVNCGAIPKDLIESELFGHVKGAFTGASVDKLGFFGAADGGSIFLDEFGELPAEAQVRLLRVLQSGEFNRVGDSKTKKVDVRVIAATNRNLSDDITKGIFREDLFYRVAVGVLLLPPLRLRKGDLGLLAEALMEDINNKATTQPGYIHKKISPKAKNIIIKHQWPGNVRELYATLLRASIWSDGDKLTEKDLQEALLEAPKKVSNLLGRDFNKSFKIEELIDDIKRHYIERALIQSQRKKTEAAELLGIGSYQVLSGWMKKLDIK